MCNKGLLHNPPPGGPFPFLLGQPLVSQPTGHWKDLKTSESLPPGDVHFDFTLHFFHKIKQWPKKINISLSPPSVALIVAPLHLHWATCAFLLNGELAHRFAGVKVGAPPPMKSRGRGTPGVNENTFGRFP